MRKIQVIVPAGEEQLTPAKDYNIVQTMEMGDERFCSTIERYPLDGDGHINVVRTQVYEDLSIDVSSTSDVILVVNAFVGHGTVRFKLSGTEMVSATPRRGYVAVAADAGGQYDLRKGDNWSSISSTLSVPLLEQKLDGLVPSTIKQAIAVAEDKQQLIAVPSTPDMGTTVKMALNADINDSGLRRLYFESVLTQLLVQRAAIMSNDSAQLTLPSMTKRDKDAVHDAHSMLLSDLHQPPALYEIANTVGLSERRLIDCMKREFNQTPAEMLRTARLEQSIELLRDGKKKIKEIAYLVGYNHAANYSIAFKRQYGMAPREYMKRLNR